MWRKPLPSFLFKSLCPSLCSCECEGTFLHIYWCLVIVGAPPFYIQGALLLPGIVCSTLTRFPKKMPALKVYIFNLFYSFIITKDFLINKKQTFFLDPFVSVHYQGACPACTYGCPAFVYRVSSRRGFFSRGTILGSTDSPILLVRLSVINKLF